MSYPLIEFVTGRPLPDAVYHHPLLREIARPSATTCSPGSTTSPRWTGTRPPSGGHNLVLALAAERGVPVAAAVELVGRALAGRDAPLRQRCARRCRRSVRRWTRPVAAHLDGVADAVRGTMDWTLESARYALAKEAPA